MAKKKTKRKKASTGKAAVKKTKPKSAAKAKAPKKKAAKSKSKPARRGRRGRPSEGEVISYGQRGLGARYGGQAGDTQGLRTGPDADSESVEELLEEGQSFEAEVVNGVENAPDPDEGEVRTREIEENDVPGEYRDKD